MCLRSDTAPTTVVSASQMLKWAKLIQVCILFKRPCSCDYLCSNLIHESDKTSIFQAPLLFLP